jgi:hypothetical protein
MLVLFIKVLLGAEALCQAAHLLFTHARHTSSRHPQPEQSPMILFYLYCLMAHTAILSSDDRFEQAAYNVKYDWMSVRLCCEKFIYSVRTHFSLCVYFTAFLSI